MNELVEYIDRPKQVVRRPNLGTSVLISGFDPEDVSSLLVLGYLNNEDSDHLPFTSIVAHVEDEKKAKKRMIGRNARYTGLLDKLNFTVAESAGALPTVEQLGDISSWVAHVVGDGGVSQLEALVDVAEAAPSVKNVAIVMSSAQTMGNEALKKAEEMIKSKATTFAYTLVVVGEWDNEPEAANAFGIYNITDVGASSEPLIGEGETFSRAESLRIVTECLAIDKAAGKSVVATKAKGSTSVESKLIATMREIGYSRPQEIEYLMYEGVKGYNNMLAERNNSMLILDDIEPEDEDPEFISRKLEEALVFKQYAETKSRKEEVEALARAWAEDERERRLFSGKMIQGVNTTTYFDIVYDRAMFEGDIKLRRLQGEEVDEIEERMKFKVTQEKKKKEEYEKVKKAFDEWNWDDVLEMDAEEEMSLGDNLFK